MVSLTDFFFTKAIPFTVSILCTMASFGMLYKASFLYIRKDVPFSRLLLGDFLTALAFHLPQFIAAYFIYPNMLDPVTDSILLFPSPLYVFFYYYIFRKIFRISSSYIFQVLETIILGQYIIMLVFKLFSNIWSSFFHMEYSIPVLFDTDLAAMISTVLAVFVFMLLILYLSRRKNVYVDIPYGYPEPNVRRELLRTFLMAAMSYMMLVIFSLIMFEPRREGIDLDSTLLYCIIIVLTLLFSLEDIRRRSLDIKKWQTQAAEHYVESALNAANEFRSFRHDYANIIQVYNGYITAENFGGLKKYNETVVNKLHKAHGDITLLSALRSRTAVYTLMSAKIHLAQSMGIHCTVGDIRHLVDVGMNDFDFCRVLGCLLDNAIEAASDTEDKFINIQVKRTEAGAIQLSISNSTGHDVDTERIFEAGFTTKENHDGQGMYAVHKIIESNEGCTIDIAYKENHFTVNLSLIPV